MALAPNTGSTLSRTNGSNKTSVSLSTNILIVVGTTPVGAVQSISVNENRPVKFFGEIGTDGHIDSAPTGSTNIGGNCTRIRFDRLRIAEAFSRGFVHVRSQAYPFDIVIFDKQKDDTANVITTTIKNVWIKSINTTYNADNWIISDTMDWEGETIYSTYGPGSKPVAQGGERGIKYFGDDNFIERQTDTGKNGRRGSLDAYGLIDLGAGTDIF